MATLGGKRSLVASAGRHDPYRVYRAGAGSHHFIRLVDKGFQRERIETWLARPHFQLRFNAEYDALLMSFNVPLMPATQSPTVIVR
jgi:hypothetical protein